MSELNTYEVARLEAEIGRLLRSLAYIRELVEDKVDIDQHGGANLAMQVYDAVQAALSTK